MLNFTKMQSLGNDFVMLDGVRQEIRLSSQQLRFIADRNRGVGCDQVLMAQPAQHAGADFRFRIYNADGSEAGQCGNGARCFARYLLQKGLTDKSEIRIEIPGGMADLHLLVDGDVRVNMGVPVFDPQSIPLSREKMATDYTLSVDEQLFCFAALSMGNPHAVIRVDDTDRYPVHSVGPGISNHEVFPDRCNVGFMQVVSAGQIRLRVYERGVGETLACGSGACAAVVAGRRWGILQESVIVQLPGGKLQIEWAGQGESVWMTGPTEHVYEGTIELTTL